MALRERCAPVVGVTGVGPTRTYTQDSSQPVTLKIVDQARGVVTCPLYQDGLCRGKQPCVVNDVDMYTTVVVAPVPD